MGRRSVVVKLWVAFTGLILFVMIPLELALDRLLTDFYAAQVTEPLLYHSTQLAEMLATDPHAIAVAPMMGRMVGGKVLVLDPAGKPLAFSGSAAVAPPPEAITAALAGFSFTGQVDLGEQGLSIVTAVPIAHRSGAVVLVAPAEPVRRSLQLARRYLWLASGVTLLAGTGLALMLARGLLRPVIAVEQATRRIARGDFSTRVDVASKDELGRLAGAVNQMTTQLQAYETRRREFLANVAHELRTPLSYIRGYAQALSEGLVAAPEERDRYQRIVHEESARLSRLVDDLMSLALWEEGQMTLDLAPLDLILPIEQAVATVQPLAEEKGVRITANLETPLPQPGADAGRIQQVVFNLLDNALRHTPAGGKVTVSAAADAGFVTIRVTDTGPGIDTADVPLLFERFYKGDGTGRGLGLAIVRSIVRAHGGEVGGENRPGGGAVFWFRLPLGQRVFS